MLMLRSTCHCRFNDHWRFVIQRLCFLATFIVYLESERMITREECAEMLGGRLHIAVHHDADIRSAHHGYD